MAGDRRADDSSPPPPCAACGAPVVIDPREPPRLRLFCDACRPRDGGGDEPGAPGPRGAGLVRARWPARRVLRLLLFTLALCIALIRLLDR